MNFKVSAAPPNAMPPAITQSELETVVKQLEEITHQRRCDAAIALSKIALLPEDQATIGQRPRALSTLVVLLGSHINPAAKLAAVSILATLASHPDNQVKIGETRDAIINLVLLLLEEKEYPAILREAVNALANLALHPDNRVLIGGTPSALETLVDLCQDEDPTVRQAAATALKNLARSPVVLDKIRDIESDIAPLVRLLPREDT